MPIHRTAVIDPQAELDPTVDVGPYVVIEGPVKVAANTRIKAHALLSGWTQIGRQCEIHPFAVIGGPPQDFHYKGERSYTNIGDRVVIREGATIHRGTQLESTTVIGDDCLLMVYAHVGHNCQIARGAKAYNMVAVAGHVEIGESAIVSAYALLHQFIRIGQLAFVAAGARVTMDVPPFMTCYGVSTIVQYNAVGMQRAGCSPDEINEIREAFRILYRSGQLFRKSVEQVAAMVKTPAGRTLADFIAAPSKRGYCTGSIGHRPRTQKNHPDSP